MQVIVTKENKSLATELTIAVTAVAAIATFVMGSVPVLVPGLLALFSVLAAYSYYDREILFVIDEDGIYDTRLGVGKILWRDVVDVQIEMAYRTRFLCLTVRDPQKFRRPHHGRQKLNFNIDLSGVNVNLLSLKAFVETNMAG